MTNLLPKPQKVKPAVNLKERALMWAARGIGVFPCLPGTKLPATPHGYKDWTTDPSIIEAWWRVTPDANIGIYPWSANMLVIDLDLYENPDPAIVELVRSSSRFVVRSAAGGLHCYFSADDVPYSNGKRLGHGIDIRCFGGYVLAPGSMIDHRDEKASKDEWRRGTYELEFAEGDIDNPAPPAILERLIVATPKDATVELTDELRERLDQPDDIKRAVDYLAKLLERDGPWGQFDPPETYPIIARLRDLGISPAKTAELMACGCAEEAWLATQIVNCWKYAQRAAPAIDALDPRPAHEEFAAGLADPDLTPWDGGNMKVLSAEKPTAPTRRNRFGGRMPEADATLPPMTYWDNDQTLPRGPFVGIVYGEEGSHKTGVFIMHALDAIERQGGRVLYLAAEGAFGIKRSRLPVAREARDMPWATLNAAWRTEDAAFDLLSREDHALLHEAHRDLKPNLIFIDVLTKVTTEDISTPKGGAAIMSAASDLALRFDATVVIAHHPGKDPTKGAMGSKLFTALADFVWKVWANGGEVWVKVKKMKDGPADHSHAYIADMTRGAPVIRPRTVAEQMIQRAAQTDPLVEAIKDLLIRGGDTVYDMGGLIDALCNHNMLPGGIKHARGLITSMVAEGDLAGFAEVRGTGKNVRYTFRRGPAGVQA